MEQAMAAREVKSGAKAPVFDKRYVLPFVMVTSLFFAWGVAGALNDVLVRQFQKALAVSRTESSFIQFAFYIGYFCAALPAGLVIRRFGYKSAILVGLALYALGALMFYPAAEWQRFIVFLIALYVIAFGLAFLETAANPYIAILGAPETSSSRLNFAQSFFCVGATVGPLIGGAFIFSGVEHGAADLAAMAPAELAAYRASEARALQIPYLVIAGLVALLAAAISLTPFPDLMRGVKGASEKAKGSVFAVLRHRRLRYAVLAQFFYTGAQVSIWAFFIDFAKAATPHYSEKLAAYFLSSSLALMFVGRIMGVFLQRRLSPARTLLICACVAIGLCAVAAVATGGVAVGALWATSLFMSIMFPTIFALGVEGLNEETDLGASYLIMAIIGAALLPLVTGYVSEHILNIQQAMIVPLLCLCVCGGFALAAPRLIAGDAAKG
jgi:FHS family L-fucose permease-like MFS transporter